MLEKLWTMAPSEVPMVEPDVRRQIHVLRGHGWGTKAIAAELGIARNTVKRYVVLGERAAIQIRPNRRVLDDAGRAEAERLFDGSAEGNAVVVARMLCQQGYAISNRRCQELLEERRRARRVAQVATVRYETAPRLVTSSRWTSVRNSSSSVARWCGSSCWWPCSGTRVGCS
jgi:transposase